jgi:hypothetical protein
VSCGACLLCVTHSPTGGVSDTKAKYESVYESEVEGVTPVCGEEEENGFEEKLREEKKLTKKLIERIKKLEADTKKMEKALAIGVKCAKQLLGTFLFYFIFVCVCLLIYVHVVC